MMRPQGHGAQLLLPGGCQNKQFLVLFVFPSESPQRHQFILYLYKLNNCRTLN